jgi:TetR/AcrR family tetracycline transcriptional repressor
MLGEASVGAETFDLAPDLLARIEQLPAGQAPTLTRIVAELGPEGMHYDFDSGFETGLDLLVAGIAAWTGHAVLP